MKFRRKPSTQELFNKQMVKSMRMLSETLSLLNQKVNSITIPNPISEDDWLELAGRDEPDAINKIIDVRKPKDWTKDKPF